MDWLRKLSIKNRLMRVRRADRATRCVEGTKAGRFCASMAFAILSLGIVFIGWAGETPQDLTEMSIQDLMNVTIETVSKFEQKVTESPAFVTIIRNDDVKKYGYRNLADILRSVPGLFVNNDRNYQYLGIRGFSRPGDYNTRFLLLVDGHRVNDNIFDTAPIGNDFFLDIDLIDRVEVIQGPGSSLYGTNAFFGIINVKTKSGKDYKGLEVSGEGGSFTTFKGRSTYGNKFKNGLEMLVSGSLYTSEGDRKLYFSEFDSPATNHGIAKDCDDERYGSFFGKLSFNQFSLEGAYVTREKQIPTGSFDTVFNNPDTKTRDDRGFLDLKYEHLFTGWFEIKARAYYDHYRYSGDYIYQTEDNGVRPFLYSNKDKAESESAGGELQFARTFFEKHRAILGGEYQNVFRQVQRNYDFSIHLDDQRSSYHWALYLQDEFEIFKNLRLNAGIRYDHYSTFGGTTNPRIALIYSPFEKTILKLTYGEAFRAPNVFELYYQDAETQKPSPDLQPEKIKTLEFIFQQYLGLNIWGTANLYYQRIENLITQGIDPADGLIVFRNAEEVKAKGIQLELEGRWKNGIRGRFSYTLQDTEDKETGETLTNSPTHLLKLNGILPILKEKLFLSIEEQYTSRRKTLAGHHTGDAFVTNVTLFSKSFLKGLEMSASIYNLFDQKYSDPGGGEHWQDKIEQDGRTFRVKLTYRF
jgi:outer membrane receptor for ferrienterochelin and colicins